MGLYVQDGQMLTQGGQLPCACCTASVRYYAVYECGTNNATDYYVTATLTGGHWDQTPLDGFTVTTAGVKHCYHVSNTDYTTTPPAGKTDMSGTANAVCSACCNGGPTDCTGCGTCGSCGCGRNPDCGPPTATITLSIPLLSGCHGPCGGTSCVKLPGTTFSGTYTLTAGTVTGCSGPCVFWHNSTIANLFPSYSDCPSGSGSGSTPGCSSALAAGNQTLNIYLHRNQLTGDWWLVVMVDCLILFSGSAGTTGDCQTSLSATNTLFGWACSGAYRPQWVYDAGCDDGSVGCGLVGNGGSATITFCTI